MEPIYENNLDEFGNLKKIYKKSEELLSQIREKLFGKHPTSQIAEQMADLQKDFKVLRNFADEALKSMDLSIISESDGPTTMKKRHEKTLEKLQEKAENYKCQRLAEQFSEMSLREQSDKCKISDLISRLSISESNDRKRKKHTKTLQHEEGSLVKDFYNLELKNSPIDPFQIFAKYKPENEFIFGSSNHRYDRKYANQRIIDQLKLLKVPLKCPVNWCHRIWLKADMKKMIEPEYHNLFEMAFKQKDSLRTGYFWCFFCKNILSGNSGKDTISCYVCKNNNVLAYNCNKLLSKELTGGTPIKQLLENFKKYADRMVSYQTQVGQSGDFAQKPRSSNKSAQRRVKNGDYVLFDGLPYKVTSVLSTTLEGYTEVDITGQNVFDKTHLMQKYTSPDLPEVVEVKFKTYYEVESVDRKILAKEKGNPVKYGFYLGDHLSFDNINNRIIQTLSDKRSKYVVKVAHFNLDAIPYDVEIDPTQINEMSQ